MNVLVTGGAGYIGSHTCIELLNKGHELVIYDNFCNSHPNVVDRIKKITNKDVTLVNGDVLDQDCLEETLKLHKCTAVIHFAGLKAVGDSVKEPLAYYENNVVGTLRLLAAMRSANVRKLVFSSSATVYGDPQALPIPETHPLGATNPYGRTKLMVEEILHDFHAANSDFNVSVLRYFNPVGAHESGLIGEDPLGTPNNLMPFVAQVAVDRRPQLSVWGGDYATHDGTGVRDYIHVMDLAEGHVCALQQLESTPFFTVNLGTGQGYSVLDVVRAFEKASGKSIPYTICPRRPGDIAACYANPELARTLLGWQATRDLSNMCVDTWRWQSLNPTGYAS
ncbi:UDP-glucose 4-epimerase GalE [Pseudomonas nitroreducens]|uniref:UDP-glucose 4-epimerase GalE n=1 Tax=Pseudomonas nitroreducens TaxID=46680 RepID=UPI002F351CB8